MIGLWYFCDPDMSSIPNHRRLEYARGYIELGMISEANAELNAMPNDARWSTEALRIRVDLYMHSKEWELVVTVAKAVCEATPADEGAWIAWAFALRELQQVKEAEDVLLRAELLHGKTCGVLHYNLACYACLLGDTKEARRRLTKACKMNPEWKTAALDDDDLRALREDLSAG